MKTDGRHVSTSRQPASAVSRSRPAPPPSRSSARSGSPKPAERAYARPRTEREAYRGTRSETDIGRHSRAEHRRVASDRAAFERADRRYRGKYRERGKHYGKRHRDYRHGYRYRHYYPYRSSYRYSPWRYHRSFYPSFYGLFWTPYWAWYSGPYSYRVYSYPVEVHRGSSHAGPPGALDLDVSPEKAQIYIDGEYVGVADQYDGFPAYLHLPPGTYEVAIYHEGYETIFRQYSIYSGVVIDVEDRMRPGEALHPDDRGPTSTKNRDERIRRNREREAEARRIEEEMAAVEEGAPADRPASRVPGDEALAGDVGRLHLEIWPADAAVYLDGHFLGTGEEVGGMSAGLVLTPGSHRVQVIRPGHLPRDLDLDVDRGERLDLVIELEPADAP